MAFIAADLERLIPCILLQGIVSSSLKTRENLLHSLHASVQELQEAWNALETWHHQSCMPVEGAMFQALQKADKSKLVDPQVGLLGTDS